MLLWFFPPVRESQDVKANIGQSNHIHENHIHDKGDADKTRQDKNYMLQKKG